jgi:hypothetical protein
VSDNNAVIFSSKLEVFVALDKLRGITSQYCPVGHFDHSYKDTVKVEEVRKLPKELNTYQRNYIKTEFSRLDKEVQYILSYFRNTGNIASFRNILSCILAYYPRTVSKYLKTLQ